MESPVPLYYQVAARLRERIRTDLAPDCALASEQTLCVQFGVGRMTIRRALALLRDEGLISTRRGQPTVIRSRKPRVGIVMGAEQRLVARMPTATERLALNLDTGVPLLELTDPAGATQLLPADRYEILGPPADA